MLLTNLSGREKLFFCLTATVVFLGLVYNFVFKPLGANWSRLNRQILAKEIELKRNIRYLQQEAQTKDAYRQYARYVKEKGLDEKEAASLLSAVEEKARSLGIRVNNIRPKSAEETAIYKKYIIEINCQATMNKYIEYIYKLQGSAQLIKVEKLRLLSQGKNNPLLKAQLIVTKMVIVD